MAIFINTAGLTKFEKQVNKVSAGKKCIIWLQYPRCVTFPRTIFFCLKNLSVAFNTVPQYVLSIELKVLDLAG